MSEGFNIGWQDACDWFKENCHIDKQGYYNVMGYKVTEIMKTFINKPHGYDAGFAEGLIYSCWEKPEQ